MRYVCIDDKSEIATPPSKRRSYRSPHYQYKQIIVMDTFFLMMNCLQGTSRSMVQA